MLEQASITECVGKTIQALEQSWPGDMAVVFTDGTFVFLKAEEEREYDSVTCYLRSTEVSLDPDNFQPGSHCLEKAGVYSREEIEAAHEAVHQQRQESERLRRQEEFKRLKREFEPPTARELEVEQKAQWDALQKSRQENSRNIVKRMYEK